MAQVEAAEPTTPLPASTTHPAAPPEAVPVVERPRRRAAAAARAVLLAVLFAVTLEGTSRVEELVRHGTPFFSRATSHADLMVVDADGAHGRPGAQFGKWAMNALGMRGPDVAAAKAPGTVRVVTVGASETFGLYETAGREYPRQLEDTLRSRGLGAACGGGARVEVLNAALAGMSLPTIAQDVRTRLRRLRPDVIVVYPTPAGFLDYAPPRSRAPEAGPARALPWYAAARPRVLTRFRDQAKLLLPGPLATWLRRRDTEKARRRFPADSLFETIPQERLALFELGLRQVVGEVRAIGAEPVLATHANAFRGRGALDSASLASWERFYPRARGHTIVAFDEAAGDVTMRVARDSGVGVADVAARLASAGGAFADFVHFTDAGAAHVAGVLAEPTLAAARAACGDAAHSSSR